MPTNLSWLDKLSQLWFFLRAHKFYALQSMAKVWHIFFMQNWVEFSIETILIQEVCTWVHRIAYGIRLNQLIDDWEQRKENKKNDKMIGIKAKTRFQGLRLVAWAMTSRKFHKPSMNIEGTSIVGESRYNGISANCR